MWGHLYHPFRLDLNHVTHVLKSSQNQLVIYDTFRLVFVQHRTRMHSDAKHRFGGFVDILAMVASTVAKEGTCYTFSNICILVIFIYTQFLVIYVNLHPFHQSCQLLPNISSSSQRSHLHKIISAPLTAILKLFPSIVNVE